MASYLSSKIKINKSRNGKGLFALEKIQKLELIIDYTKGYGKFLTTEEVIKFCKEEFDYALQIDNNLFYGATNLNELEEADFLNHSCNPNCGVRNKLEIIAMREINKDEEVTIDYAMTESFKYKMKCNCGMSNCRKIITGKDWKINKLQEKYKEFFSKYLKKKIEKDIQHNEVNLYKSK